MYCASKAVMWCRCRGIPHSLLFSASHGEVKWKLWIHLGSGCANRVTVARMFRYTEQWTGHSVLTVRTCPLIQVKIWWAQSARTTEERCDWCTVRLMGLWHELRPVLTLQSSVKKGDCGPWPKLLGDQTCSFVCLNWKSNQFTDQPFACWCGCAFYTSVLHVAYMHQLSQAAVRRAVISRLNGAARWSADNTWTTNPTMQRSSCFTER